MGRAEAAGDDDQITFEPCPQRRLDLVGLVADDPKLPRVDPEREQRPGQERPVQVVTVAADELRPGDDNRRAERAQPVCTPLGVTVSTTGFPPASGTALPPTMTMRFSGELRLTQKRLPL